MAPALTERMSSRAYGTDGSLSLIYDYRDGGSDAAVAYVAATALLPGTVDSRSRVGYVGFDPVFVDTENDDGHYTVTARYVPAGSDEDRQAEGEVVVRIGTVGRTTHITTAYDHIEDYPAAAPDHLGSIGVTDDGVEGVDVSDPMIIISVTRRYLAASLPATATMLGLRGKVNSDVVTIKDTRKNRTWTIAAGELLCEGVSEGTLDDDGLVTVQFEFSASQNQASMTVGGITTIVKKGWEHVWVEYQTIGIAIPKIVTPKYAHVEQIYPTTAMDGLGMDGT